MKKILAFLRKLFPPAWWSMGKDIAVIDGGPKNRDRNKPCPCGSQRKYKKCCFNSDRVEYYRR